MNYIFWRAKNEQDPYVGEGQGYNKKEKKEEKQKKGGKWKEFRGRKDRNPLKKELFNGEIIRGINFLTTIIEIENT